jgi:hypothetical protein
MKGTKMLYTSQRQQIELLAQALALAITAPTEEKSEECAQMAEAFARGLPIQTIEKCKVQALEMVGMA